MNADMILKKKEDAVSPVIGVMLMLVVTIVIAAVVAAFASGMGGDVDMAPTAALDVAVYSNGNVKITSLAGEKLVTKDIDVKVQNGNTEVGPKGLETGYSSDAPAHFSPGSTVTVSMGSTFTEDSYVTVVITSEDKFVVLSKEVMVKKA